MCVYVYVCMCVRERERRTDRKRQTDRQSQRGTQAGKKADGQITDRPTEAERRDIRMERRGGGSTLTDRQLVLGLKRPVNGVGSPQDKKTDRRTKGEREREKRSGRETVTAEAEDKVNKKDTRGGRERVRGEIMSVCKWIPR